MNLKRVLFNKGLHVEGKCGRGLNAFFYKLNKLGVGSLRAVICFLWVNGFQLDVCLLNND